MLVADSPSPSGRPAPALRFADPRIDESSGLAAGRARPGILYTHNDSGDVPRLFAVDRTGRTAGVYAVRGASAVDWEDMAAGPDEQGRPALWIADTGDNGAVRREVALYLMPEPAGGSSTVAATRYRITYADGPHDVEALLVDPRDRHVYLVSKDPTGSSTVYGLPARLDPAGVNVARPVSTLTLSPAGTTGGPAGPFSELLVTGGAFAADGRRFAVRTYTDAYVWTTGSGGVVRTMSGRPVRIPLPRSRQGEGLAFAADGTALLTSSEGRRAPVYSVPLPALPPLPSAGPPDRDVRGGGNALPALAGLAAVGAAAGLVVLLRRRVRRAGPSP